MNENSLTREEMELLHFFRNLPIQQRLDVLSAAESHFNAFERMKELSERQVERHLGTETEGAGWH